MKGFSRLDSHTFEVIQKSLSSLFVRVNGRIVSLLISLYIGRVLGTEGLGIISLSNNVITILLVVTTIGLPNVLIKNISIGINDKNWKAILSNNFTGLILAGSIALFVTIIGILSSEYVAVGLFHSANLIFPLKISFGVLIPQTLSRIYASSLIGLGKVWQGNLVNETLSSWIVGVGLLVLYLFDVGLDLDLVIIIYAVGRICVTICMGSYWYSLTSGNSGSWQFIQRQMMKMALPLLLVSSTSVIASNADSVMLGWLSDMNEVGLYTVAAKVALLVSFVLSISNNAIGPKLASMYSENRIQELEKMVQKVTAGLIAIGLIVVLSFCLGGKAIMSLWGAEFVDAYMVLLILGIGQFFNISTGCSGMLLIMCGYEKLHGYLSVGFVLLNLVLNYFLIVRFGAVGAASATAITTIGENLFKVILAKRNVGVLSIPNFHNILKFGK